MRFARLGEEVFIRHHELTGEELRLYMIIVYHTFIDTGLCRRSITEISKIHGLIRNHTSERFKVLRKKGWCKNEKGGIRPLIGLKSPKIGLSEVQKSDNESPENGLVKSKNRTNENENSPNIGLSLIPYTEPLKPEPLNSPLSDESEEKNSNGHHSKFSLAECLRYTEKLKAGGAAIRNPNAYAMTLYKTGDSDSFIEAALYPPELTYEPDENTTSARLDDGLKMLLEIEAEGDDVGDFKKWYTEDEWQWLMSELAKCHGSN